MLDTNAVSAFLQRRSPRLDGWVREQRCCLSAIVVAEIRYGLEKLPAATRLQELAEATLETLEILPWSEACARVFGRLRADLERADTPLGPIDTLIAATALATRAVLVTHNTREFGRVRGLEVEDWFDPTVPRVRMFLQEPDPPTYKAPRVAAPRKRSATAAARR